MNTYTYTILDRKGNKVVDTIDAESLAEARKIIELNGKTLIEIKEASFFSKLKVAKKVTKRDLAIFCQQMSSMLKSGVTITDSMDMVAVSTTNRVLKEAILGASDKVKKGSSLADGMVGYPQAFPFILVKMTESGEASGAMDIIFYRMSVQFEKEYKTHQTVKKATAYPKAVLILSFAALMVICIFVMPMFTPIFEEVGSELPAITQFMLDLSDLIKGYWYFAVIIVTAIVLTGRLFLRSQTGKTTINNIKMKIALIRRLEECSAAATMSRLLSTLLGAGMYMGEALGIVKGTMSNEVYRDAVDDIKLDITNGYSLYDAVESTHLFPLLMLNLINIGEKTGDISVMLEKSANYFEEEVDRVTKSVVDAIQPILIIFLGALVGLMVYAVYSPMMNIYSGLSGG